MGKLRNEQQETAVSLESLRCLLISTGVSTQLMTGKVFPMLIEELLCEGCIVLISLASLCCSKDTADPVSSITLNCTFPIITVPLFLTVATVTVYGLTECGNDCCPRWPSPARAVSPGVMLLTTNEETCPVVM